MNIKIFISCSALPEIAGFEDYDRPQECDFVIGNDDCMYSLRIKMSRTTVQAIIEEDQTDDPDGYRCTVVNSAFSSNVYSLSEQFSVERIVKAFYVTTSQRWLVDHIDAELAGVHEKKRWKDTIVCIGLNHLHQLIDLSELEARVEEARK